MAAGTFERPVLPPTDERSLLELGGFTGAMKFEMTAGQTRYLSFNKEFKIGLLATWGNGVEADGKSSLYSLSSGTSATISLSAIKAVSRTGVTITPLSNQAIEIVNPSGSSYMWVAVIMFYGKKPTVEVTQPT